MRKSQKRALGALFNCSIATLAAASWPRPEYYEYKTSLLRKVVRLKKDEKHRELRKFLARQCLHWGWAAGFRALRLLPFWRMLT
jgi:hypothetical protein